MNPPDIEILNGMIQVLFNVGILLYLLALVFHYLEAPLWTEVALGSMGMVVVMVAASGMIGRAYYYPVWPEIVMAVLGVGVASSLAYMYIDRLREIVRKERRGG